MLWLWTEIQPFALPDEFTISKNGTMMKEYIFACKSVFLCKWYRPIGVSATPMFQLLLTEGLNVNNVLNHFNETTTTGTKEFG